MKTYKNSEALAMLEKNPKLKFTYDNVYNLYVRENKIIIENTLKKDNDYEFYLDDKWTLIEEPITFIEAVAAFNKGKMIKCVVRDEFNQKDIITTYKKTIYCRHFKDSEGYPLSTDEVLKGKWYIEE